MENTYTHTHATGNRNLVMENADKPSASLHRNLKSSEHREYGEHKKIDSVL